MASGVDRTRFSYRHHSFLVFVDGVEIPWMFLQIRTALGSPTTVEIFVEPDDLIERLRPRSYVHVFMSDPYNEDAPEGRPDLEYDRNSSYDRYRYYLCFEGELQGITESESAESRSMVLSCSDLMSVINNTTLNLVQLNNGIHLPMVNGSTFYGSFITANGDARILNYVLYAAMGFGKVNTDGKSDRATRESQVAKTEDQQFPLLRDGRQGSDEYYYFDAVRLVMKYFMQYNASYRNQAMRTRLFDKMFGISDQTFQRFMDRRVAQILVNNGFENVPYSTLGELMTYTLGVGLHSYTSMLFPVANDKVKEGAWNQYLFLPNLYYAVPPACNWIFPEHVQSLNTSRFFLQEPTRIGIRDPMAGSMGLLHLAPSGLTDVLTGGAPPVQPGTPSIFSSEAIHGSNPKFSFEKRNERDLDGLTFKYNDGAENPRTNPNLLRMMTALEIEKGIVFRESDISVEYFAGIYGATDSIGTDSAFRQKNKVLKDLDDETRIQASENSPYMRYAQSIANYRLTLEQLNRDISLAGPFNPWAVAGFPAMVCRANRSYRGLLVGINHTIGSSGEAQSVYQLAYTTLFRPKVQGTGTLESDVKEIGDLSRTAKAARKVADKSIQTLKTKLPGKILSESFENVNLEAKRQLDDLKTVGDAVAELRSDVADWRGSDTLNPVIVALRTFKDNLPASAQSDTLDEIISSMGYFNNALTSTQRDIPKKTVSVAEAPLAEEAIEYFNNHTTEGVPSGAVIPAHTYTYPPTAGSTFRLVDHIFNYRTITAGVVTGYEFVGDGSVNSFIPKTEYDNGLFNTNIPLEYSRDGTTVRAPLKTQVGGESRVPDLKSINLRALVRTAIEGDKGFFPGGINAVAEFESKGAIECTLGESVEGELSDSGVDAEATVVQRTVFTFDGLVDALIDRAVYLVASLSSKSDVDKYRSVIQKQLDQTVKDESDAEAKASIMQRASDNLLKALDSLVETSPIMPFANPKLLDPASVEEAYEKVLGKSTVLKDKAPQSLTTTFQEAADSDPRLLRGVGGEALYRTAASIFSFDAENEDNTLYDEWVKAGNVPEEVNKFTRRKNAMTLQEFIERTNLSLFEETARFGPFTRTFYRLAASGFPGTVGSFSYFDKLVPNNKKITGNTAADDDVNQARSSFHQEQDQPLLYEEARQELILEYSRTHFVPRGLRGK